LCVCMCLWASRCVCGCIVCVCLCTAGVCAGGCVPRPQLTANTPEDYNLKFKLLNDMLDIIDMEGRCVYACKGFSHVPPCTPVVSAPAGTLLCI
jgi:hypothetical protein